MVDLAHLPIIVSGGVPFDCFNSLPKLIRCTTSCSVYSFKHTQNGGGVIIVTKDCYTITDLILRTAPQNETELVWATITLKDHSKLVVGSFYRPPNKGVSPILELESQLSKITDTFRNNPKTTLIMGGDFNAGGIDWETSVGTHCVNRGCVALTLILKFRVIY